MFALVDCNNFYASCERVFKPQLNGKPVAILSNNDGCVISRSDEAKAIGLPMGAPAFKFEHFFKANNVHVFSSNYALYGDMSERVMNILKQFTPDVEVYSIDEAFLAFKGFNHYNFNHYGLQIRHRIHKWTGIPTSIGIAPTKALSKAANKIARKFPEKTNHVYVIDSESQRIKALKWLPIEDVWGIGFRLAKRLRLLNVTTAYDFTLLSDDFVLKQFSITAFNLKKDLEGIPTLDLENNGPRKRAIATTRSFETTYSDLENIQERVATFAASCAEKLRKQHSSCNMIIVLLQSDRYKKDTPYYKRNATVVLPYATDSSMVICNHAKNAVKGIYNKGIRYKRAGVIVTGLVPTNNHQLDLFSKQDPKHKPLMSAIDSINNKYGDYKIKLGNQDLTRTWKMKQERLSPKYTTDINDILRIS